MIEKASPMRLSSKSLKGIESDEEHLSYIPKWYLLKTKSFIT